MKDITLRYDRLLAASRRADHKFCEFRKEVVASGECPHTRTYSFDRDNDDGYGHWWKVRMEVCQICRAERVRDGRWTQKEMV